MTIEIKAPTFPESVADGTIATWHKKPGEAVSRDELIVDIETDKVVLEIVAPDDGAISEIIKDEGDTVESEELLGRFEPGAGGGGGDDQAGESSAPAGEGNAAPSEAAAGDDSDAGPSEGDNDDVKMSPAARKLAAEKGLDASRITATGKGGLVTKEDVLKHASGDAQAKPEPAPEPAPKSEPAPAAKQPAPSQAAPVVEMDTGDKIEKRVPMTRLRKRIAERLLEATQTTAMLTTFNEVNMEPVMTLRKQYKDLFEKTHNGVRLGFMGFFVKATCEALKRFPAVNASIDGDDIVYHAYQDIGVAVSSDKGLVVPVLRDADNMGLASVEDRIRDFGARAQDGKLALEEMQGGTFTITNGGVFGSLLSTPILNPPQTAILGMHKIQERPMAVDGEVKIQPMMYLALSYDHRLIDGKEAVQFLVTIKELLEEPARILLEV